MVRVFSALLSFGMLMLGAAAPAAGQIYTWPDPNGTLVLSDRPLDPSARTFAVAGGTIRSTTPPGRPHRNRVAYAGLIEHHASEYAVRPDLVRAIIQTESGFNPLARSPKGAMGLMQLMPATAAELGIANPYDAGQNIRGGVAYLRQLLDRYDGNEELALAAYNAGPGAVDRYGWRVPPYRETHLYLAQIRARTGAIHSQAGTRVYRVVEMLGGRPVAKYTNVPSPGADEVLAARRR